MSAVFDVEVESLDLEGRGVAHREGKAVFVEGALPGERVRYECVKSKPRYETGRVIAVLSESAARVRPRCNHFGFERGACGGCAMQHLDAGAQVAIKQRALEDALWHLGRMRPETLLPPIAGPGWGYRHRARLSVRFVARKGGVLVGFHERASSFVADMDSCEVLPAYVSALLLPLRELIGELSIRDRLPQIELAIAGRNEPDMQIVMVLRVLAAPTEADRAALSAFASRHRIEFWLQPGGPETAAPMAGARRELELSLPEFGVTLPFTPTDFTQVNHRINEVLVGRAVRLLAPKADEVVLDFFCGLGNFSLPLGTQAQRVIGFEVAPALVQRARMAAAKNGLGERTHFETKNLFEWTATDWDTQWQQHGPIDRVLVDPPREGAVQIARVLALSDQKPRRMVYVSCNPATLARDAAVLVHEGAWRMRYAGVVNMFPHTAHVESIAVFEPRTAS
jgi:23S rRNA (uracil1939-C5)-methyltransferase